MNSLTNEELCALLQKEKEGSEEFNKIAEVLLIKNRGIIEKSIKSVPPISSIINYSDKLQIGYMALIEIAKKFDISKGFKFSTYANKSLVQRIRREEYSTLPLGNGICLEIINSFFAKFEKKNNRQPTIEEIAEGTNISRETVFSCLTAKDILSLDKSVKTEEDNDSTYLDFIKSENKSNYKSLIYKVSKAINFLPKGDKDICQKIFIERMTKVEYAKTQNCTFQAIDFKVKRLKNQLKLLISDEGNEYLFTLNKLRIYAKKLRKYNPNFTLDDLLNFSPNKKYSLSKMYNIIKICYYKYYQGQLTQFVSETDCDGKAYLLSLNEKYKELIKKLLLGETSPKYKDPTYIILRRYKSKLNESSIKNNPNFNEIGE